LARTAAGFASDVVVIKELPGMLRGRALGDLPALLEQGLWAAGLGREHARHISDEAAAAWWLLEWARPGDVVVLPVRTLAVRQQLAQVLGGRADIRSVTC